jgi:hypothetical protein
MSKNRSSEQIKIELQQAKETHRKKVEERDALEKQLETIDAEIAKLLHVTSYGKDRKRKYQS